MIKLNTTFCKKCGKRIQYTIRLGFWDICDSCIPDKEKTKIVKAILNGGKESMSEKEEQIHCVNCGEMIEELEFITPEKDMVYVCPECDFQFGITEKQEIAETLDSFQTESHGIRQDIPRMRVFDSPIKFNWEETVK